MAPAARIEFPASGARGVLPRREIAAGCPLPHQRRNARTTLSPCGRGQGEGEVGCAIQNPGTDLRLSTARQSIALIGTRAVRSGRTSGTIVTGIRRRRSLISTGSPQANGRRTFTKPQPRPLGSNPGGRPGLATL